MKAGILKIGVMYLLLVGVVLLIPALAFADPLSICVSKAAGGDWSSSNTWQFCSSGGSVPSATDDVYIIGPVTLTGATTAASVTVDNGGTLNGNGQSFTAGNLMVNAGGTFNAGTGTVTLTGNLTNNGTINHQNGTVTFAGTSTQGAGGSNVVAFNHLTLDNAAGLSLSVDVTVNGTLNLANGDLSTGSKMLHLTASATVTSSTGGDVVGNVKRSHAFTPGTNYTFNHPNTLVNFGTLAIAPTELTVNLSKSVPGGLPNAVPRTYSITAGGSPSFSATVRLHYKSSEGGFTNEAILKAWRQTAGQWNVQAGGVTPDGNNSYVTATSVTGFSLWAIAENAPTAVKLASLSTTNQSDSNILSALGLLGAIVLLMACGARCTDFLTSTNRANVK